MKNLIGTLIIVICIYLFPGVYWHLSKQIGGPSPGKDIRILTWWTEYLPQK